MEMITRAQLKKELDSTKETIQILENRIWKLENPPEVEVGDKVLFCLSDILGNVIKGKATVTEVIYQEKKYQERKYPYWQYKLWYKKENHIVIYRSSYSENCIQKIK